MAVIECIVSVYFNLNKTTHCQKPISVRFDCGSVSSCNAKPIAESMTPHSIHREGFTPGLH